MDPLSEAEFTDLMSRCGGGASSNVAVAVSGGADSMALVLLAHRWAQAAGISITALTVDHGLRKESQAEALKVKAWLSVRGIKHEILTWQPPKNMTTALQARARTARYGLMIDWCLGHNAGAILLAHHLGDQAETVLMRMKKRSTLYGLGGMAPVRDQNGVNVCRPLLSVPKSRLIATLNEHGQDWVEDPSNQNLAFERVRVRAQMVQLEKQGITAERLAGVAKSARAVCDVIDKAADILTESSVSELEGPKTKVSLAFVKAPNRVAERALSKLLMKVGKCDYPPNPEKLKRLLEWMGKPGQKARTLGGTIIRSQNCGFEIVKEISRKVSR
ncbi:MAG: tRNA lysidine(34) synthetase TilS [Magnetovibrio sp.]|nr:tRNA lysidine(34) synthetase TilS [Magnetovibrio sp.]